jgi:hypothetical protein
MEDDGMTRSHDNHSDRLERLLGPTGYQVSCEQCFELLDEYVELELEGVDADARIPGLRTHLDACQACREDYESLRALVGVEDAAP